MHYDGPGRMGKQAQEDVSSVDVLAQQDVVISTYDVLKREIWLAKAILQPTTRTMRGTTRGGHQHQPPRSPLIGVMWWRVCIDEAQMVEAVTSRVAEMAQIIPCVNAWCVTGTPVKNNVGKGQEHMLALVIASSLRS